MRLFQGFLAFVSAAALFVACEGLAALPDEVTVWFAQGSSRGDVHGGTDFVAVSQADTNSAGIALTYDMHRLLGAYVGETWDQWPARAPEPVGTPLPTIAPTGPRGDPAEPRPVVTQLPPAPAARPGEGAADLLPQVLGAVYGPLGVAVGTAITAGAAWLGRRKIRAGAGACVNAAKALGRKRVSRRKR